MSVVVRMAKIAQGELLAMLLHILIEWTYITRRMDAILAITKVAIFQ